MSHLQEMYPPPVLAAMPETVKMVYNASEWDRMHQDSPVHMDDSQMVMDPVLNQLYAKQFQDANPNNAHDWMRLNQAQFMSKVTPTMPKTMAQCGLAKQASAKKVVAAMASWCGFSKKAAQVHAQKNLGNQIQELWCDKQDKAHPLCKKTRGFPTYYDQGGNMVQRGYTANPEKLVS